MSKYLLSAAAAAFLMVGTSGAVLAQDGSTCNLPNPDKWTCDEVESTETTTEPVRNDKGQGNVCKTGTTTTTTTTDTAYNPSGKNVSNKDGDSTEESSTTTSGGAFKCS